MTIALGRIEKGLDLAQDRAERSETPARGVRLIHDTTTKNGVR